MKSLIIISALFMAFAAEAARIECKFEGNVIVVERKDSLRVTYQGEAVPGDGILTTDEVDLVAKFKSIGEMTLFAKIGKESPESYTFINGKRFSVLCR